MTKTTRLDDVVGEQNRLAKRKKQAKRPKQREATVGLDAVIIPEGSEEWFASIADEHDKVKAELDRHKESRKRQTAGLKRSNRERREFAEESYEFWRERFRQLEPCIGATQALETVWDEMSSAGINVDQRTLWRQLRKNN